MSFDVTIRAAFPLGGYVTSTTTVGITRMNETVVLSELFEKLLILSCTKVSIFNRSRDFK